MSKRDKATDGLDFYQVGGAVRDELLGLDVKDRDYVVVGADIDDMIDRGFRQVGRDFPVFLHPDTHEEFALARCERKTGPGYRGFEVHADRDVTLEEDLERRDLTINAMARDAVGDLIDPFGGSNDIKERVLRHVSPAFVEDPVRILRIARFAARFAPLDFTVAPETNALMRDMVASGEVDALVAERVWQEMEKALGEAVPSAFLRVLRDCGALARILPEVDALYGVPQPEKRHPEVDTGRHVELVVDTASRLSERNPRVVYAALVHDLGKGLTPAAELPSHRGHERSGLPLVARVGQRLRVPRAYDRLARAVCAEHLNCHRALEMRPAKVFGLIERVDALRNPERFEEFLLVCEADARGRTGLEDRDYPQADYLRQARQAAADVAPQPLLAAGFEGPELGARLRAERIDAIRKVERPAEARP